jgi:sulfopropanediol 3-dehydrogenase
VTYQKVEPEAGLQIAGVASRIYRFEGMEDHARAADARLRKYLPKE